LRNERDKNSVQSVQRALTILAQFGRARHRWSVTDMARATGLPKSVVARQLSTMAQQQFLIQDPVSKHYSVGPEAFAVGSVYEPYAVFHQITRPVMNDLTNLTGHSTTIGVPAGDRFMIIDTLQSRASLRVAFEIGERPYYHAAAIGRLLLAAMPMGQVLDIVGPEPLPRVTPRTITSLEALERELNIIRSRGVSVSLEESIIGVGAVAAGIADASGIWTAGIASVFPMHSVSDAEIEQITDATVDAARLLSSRLRSFAPRAHPSVRPLVE
jgi:IclR family acetate operon transcriptional repressor